MWGYPTFLMLWFINLNHISSNRRRTLAAPLSQSISEWVSECRSEWVSRWVGGWVGAWVSDWVSEAGRQEGSQPTSLPAYLPACLPASQSVSIYLPQKWKYEEKIDASLPNSKISLRYIKVFAFTSIRYYMIKTYKYIYIYILYMYV